MRRVETVAPALPGLRQNLRVAERAAISFYADSRRGWKAMKMPFLRQAILKSYAEGFDLSGWVNIARPLLSRAGALSSAIDRKN